MNEKYRLTKETIVHNGKTLYRICALKDFNNVKKGDLGGYVESEKNLSQYGNCWIYGNAHVSSNAHIFDNAIIHGNANVFDSAAVFGNAIVSGNAIIHGNANVFDSAAVFGNAIVSDNAIIHGYARITGIAKVCGFANVSGDITVDCDVNLSHDALITSNRDFSSITKFGSENRTSTFFRCTDGKVRVACGCFYGTLDEFRKRVIETHENNQFAKEYLALADLMEIRFSNVKERMTYYEKEM